MCAQLWLQASHRAGSGPTHHSRRCVPPVPSVRPAPETTLSKSCDMHHCRGASARFIITHASPPTSAHLFTGDDITSLDRELADDYLSSLQSQAQSSRSGLLGTGSSRLGSNGRPSTAPAPRPGNLGAQGQLGGGGGTGAAEDTSFNWKELPKDDPMLVASKRLNSNPVCDPPLTTPGACATPMPPHFAPSLAKYCYHLSPHRVCLPSSPSSLSLPPFRPGHGHAFTP